MILRFLILILSFISFNATAEPAEQRIQFAKGRSSTVVEGKTGTDGIYYNVRAKGGQKVVLNLSSDENIGIKVEKDGSFGHEILLDEQHGGTFDIYMEEDSDFTVFLGSATGKSIAYRLAVKITSSQLGDI